MRLIPDTLETQWGIVRSKRNVLLQDCDYTQLQDASIGDRLAWTTYRQALRDITKQEDPYTIAWPVMPFDN